MSKPRILFLLTLDTEEEWDWNGPFPTSPFSTRNTSRIPRFQAFCHGLGIKPTYFVDYAVCQNEESAGHLRRALEIGECEIGAHLHPWCTPPVVEEVNPETSHIVNLPLPLVRQKIQNMSRYIEETLGVRPVSFRAGRWGVNGPVLRLLAEEGYRVDSSVFPLFSDIGFSYRAAPFAPYWPDFSDGLVPGPQREILEIPVSSGFNHSNFDLLESIHGTLASLPWRVFRGIGILWSLGLLRKINVSPELCEARDMKSCITSYLKRAHPVVNMFLHSSSLLPGCTPYVTSETDVDRLYRAIDETFRFLCGKTEVLPCTVSAARDILVEDL
jgi:hypothetical protein